MDKEDLLKMTNTSRPQKILNPERKKKLMKQLQKIKLNRSRGNNSFISVGTFYELRKRNDNLKNNNVALAKALAEQRQISQSWYEEVLSLKEENHELRQDLLQCKVNENGNFDSYVQATIGKRIKDIAEPLELSVNDSLENVRKLIENMTNTKQHLATLLKSNSEKFNYSRSSSRGSNGLRPPLSGSSKSPRRNIVHPMVEGHVLQPATIHIPRMTLEDRRRYRLQENTEFQENNGMTAIGEDSYSLPEESNEEAEQQLTDSEGIPVNERIPVNEAEDVPERSEVSSPAPESNVVSVSPLSGEISPQNDKTEAQKPKKEKSPVDMDEDPLEGASWMHMKKKKGSRKKKPRSSVPSIKRTSGMHILLESSSDSDDDYVPEKVVVKRNKKQPTVKKISNPSLSPKDIKEDSKFPELCLERLEELESKVSRRSKKKSSIVPVSGRNSHVTENGEDGSQEDVVRSVPLQSFIINDTIKNDSDLLCLQLSEDTREATSPESSPDDVIQSTSEVAKGAPQGDVTTRLDSSMEITQCLSIDLAKLANTNTSPKHSKQNENEMSNDKNQLAQKKPNKFFIKDFTGFKKEDIVNPRLVERTPYDLSMIDVTFFETMNTEKENIPPGLDSNLADSAMKLRDISIVVQDIMKGPNGTPEISPNGSIGAAKLTESCHLGGSEKVSSPLGEADVARKKRKKTEGREQNVARKVSKTSKKIDLQTQDEKLDADDNSKALKKKGKSKLNGLCQEKEVSDEKMDVEDKEEVKKKNNLRKLRVFEEIQILKDDFQDIKRMKKVKSIKKMKKSKHEKSTASPRKKIQTPPKNCDKDPSEPVSVEERLPEKDITGTEVNKVIDTEKPTVEIETSKKKFTSEKPAGELEAVNNNTSNENIKNGDAPTEGAILNEIFNLPDIVNILDEEDEIIEDDPLAFCLDIKPELPDTAVERDDDLEVICSTNISKCGSSVGEFVVHNFEVTLEESVKARPRRAASKVQSFREPTLRSKLRR